MDWALPSGIAAVKMAPVGLILYSPVLSAEEHRTAEILALARNEVLVVISYREVWEVERRRAS